MGRTLGRALRQFQNAQAGVLIKLSVQILLDPCSGCTSREAQAPEQPKNAASDADREMQIIRRPLRVSCRLKEEREAVEKAAAEAD